MFCMACGAELQPRADRCVVCGRPLDSAAQTLRQGSASSSASPLAPLASRPTNTPMAPAPTIARGDLAATGLPSDALGLALLIVVLALLVDLIVPWLDHFNVRWSPIQAGLPVLIIVAILAVALTPLVHPSLRNEPLAAVAPLLIGAATLGAAVTLWVALHTGVLGSTTTIITDTTLNQRSVDPDVVTQQSGSADLGLYLFMLGACALIYIGYRMVLAAARAGRAPSRQSSSAAAAPRASVAAPAKPASAAAPIPPSALTLVGQTKESARPQNSPPTTLAHETTATARDGAGAPQEQRIPLPGTAEWNTAPTPPSRLGPTATSGWRGQPGVRR